MDEVQISEPRSHGSQKKAASQPRGRPRAPLACTTCRLRKVKCDFLTAENSVCSACQAANTPCIINRNDKRRRSNTNEDIAFLRKRLHLLESVLQKNARQDPTASDKHQQTIESIVSEESTSRCLQRPPSHELVQPAATTTQRHEPAVATAQRHPMCLVPNVDGAPTARVDGIRSQNAHIMGQENFVNQMQFPLPIYGPPLTPSTTIVLPDPEAPCNRDRSTCESNEEECRPRFYFDPRQRGLPCFFGPTSQWHLQFHSATPEPAEEGTDSANSPEMAIEIDSPHVKRAIMESFWTSNELWSNIVEKDLFMASEADGQFSEYYSPALQDAMLACGSRNSTSNAIRRVGRIYVDRAKEGLLSRVEAPNIASLQGLLLVSNFESGNGRHRIGWTYCGMALRMLFDLGLHDDCSLLVKQGTLTTKEAAYRRRLFLAAFLYDTIWAWFLGRPRSIPLPSVTLALFYNDEDLQSNTATPTLVAWVRLCIEIAQAGDILNSSLPLDDLAIERLSQLQATVGRFPDTLPDNMTWHDSKSSPLHPSGYALHTQISAFQIQLHHIPTRSRHPMHYFDIVEDSKVVLNGSTPETSQAIVYENAVRIARLVRLLVQIHGTEQIVPTILDNIFVAAMVLIQHIASSQQLQDEDSLRAVERDKNWLQILSKTLAEAQKHYAMNLQIRQALSLAVQRTHLASIFDLDSGHENPLPSYSASGLGSSPLHQPQPPQRPPASNYTYLGSEFMNDVAFEMSPNLMTGIELCQEPGPNACPWSSNHIVQT